MLSLTIIDRSDRTRPVTPDTQVLVVVRNPASNPTHPNVVSVPTQRIPTALFEAIVSCAGVARPDPHANAVHYSAEPVDGDVQNGHHPVVFATESLLSRKLGLGDALETSAVRYRASLRSLVHGTAYYEDDGSGLSQEPIAMLNVLVEVVAGLDAVPLQTESYSMAAWSSVARFLDGVTTRAPARISSIFDPIELCVHGVCLRAAQATLSRLLDGPVPGSAESAASESLFLLPKGPRR